MAALFISGLVTGVAFTLEVQKRRGLLKENADLKIALKEVNRELKVKSRI